MQWHYGRWQVAPGAAAALAPSTWPGTQRSIAAGWLPWAGPDPAGDPAAVAPMGAG
jgi:hypothetical protein